MCGDEWRFEKHFTVAQARQLVPWLQEMFARVHALLRYGQPADHNDDNNGGGNHRRLGAAAQQLSPGESRALAEELVGRIELAGVIVRDWRRGLVDFPAILGGREVFLCYELADGDVLRFYHGLDEGYGGRRPIDDVIGSDES
jgi:hypothetical protein